MTQVTPIILCADDFALNAEASDGILQLVEMRRLSAVSCVSNSRDFKKYAEQLAPFKKQVQIGLHFNLTEGYWLSNPQKTCIPLKQVLLQSYTRTLNSTLLKNELQCQLNHFQRSFGFLPDFIDGHQHIHQFPLIRKQIIQLYEQQLKGEDRYIRATYPNLCNSPDRLKTKSLEILGGKVFKGQLQQAKIKHNPYFTGVYQLKSTVPYRRYFRQWLNVAKPHTLIMCHPGLKGPNPNEMSAVRFNEWNYFASDDFLQDCAEFKIQLIPSVIKA